MKYVQSVKKLFLLIGAGTAGTVFLLCAGIFCATRSVQGVMICLVTAAVLSLWCFLLAGALQNRLSLFTDEICRTIDDMMRGSSTLEEIFDEDTLLDRISHQLNRLYQMLQANNRNIEAQRADLQEMISDISHQVKTPATNLKMAASALLERELPRCQQVEYLQSMNAQLDKLDFLMGAMVKSSRLETGVITLEKEWMPIYETLAAAMGSIFLKAEEKHLQVSVDCPARLLVSHDPKWTAEALFNILENAVKYTPPNGTIRIAVTRWEAYTGITVTDTGRGIPESRHAAIFKRFYREPEVHGMEGIGIGLYLTRKIISKQGGYVKVSSAEGEGAAFTIFLPNE